MSFQDLVQASQKYFPDLQIKYKDKSPLMKLLGKLLFFNKSFMTGYTTTIGSTVYYPSASYIKVRPISSSVVLLHELIHVYDAKRLTKPLFGALYLSPQILALLCLPLFWFSWPLALILMLFFLSPIPSYFRMYFERRAYLTSLYCMYRLGQLKDFDPKLENQSKRFTEHFTTSQYYFMWPFKDITQNFNDAIVLIKDGKRPFEDPVFDILDDLLPSA